MKKWIELTINAMMNFCVALMAGGVLKLVLNNQSIVSSAVTIFWGIYLLFGLSLVAKNIEEKGLKMDALAWFSTILAVVATMAYFILKPKIKSLR